MFVLLFFTHTRTHTTEQNDVAVIWDYKVSATVVFCSSWTLDLKTSCERVWACVYVTHASAAAITLPHCLCGYYEMDIHVYVEREQACSAFIQLPIHYTACNSLTHLSRGFLSSSHSRLHIFVCSIILLISFLLLFQFLSLFSSYLLLSCFCNICVYRPILYVRELQQERCNF